MLDERKQQLLKLVVEQFVETAEPVGSKSIAETGMFDVSGATIRNELSFLEKEGFLTHPHTSAGRMPTEMGYRYYVENLMGPDSLHKNVQAQLLETLESEDANIKVLAKSVAEVSSNAVIVELHRDSIYYTGISYLFAQPEFQDYAQTVRVSALFDQCEQRLELVHDLMDGVNFNIFIGNENPLGSACSTIAFRTKQDTLFLMFGPLRMNYQKNIGIMKFLSESI